MQKVSNQLSKEERLEARLAFMLMPLAQVSRQQLEIMRGIDRADFEPALNAAIETARRLMVEQGGFTQDEALTELWDKYEVEVDAHQLPSVFKASGNTRTHWGRQEPEWVLTPEYSKPGTRWVYDNSELDILPKWEQSQFQKKDNR